jgi:hypothetical protein
MAGTKSGACTCQPDVTGCTVSGVWHSFLALPFIAHLVTWIVAAILALLAIIKAKAIHAAYQRATHAISKWFWGWVRSKVGNLAPNSSESKYKGIFLDYWYESTPHAMWFLKFSHDGRETTVRVNESPMLGKLKAGMFVEIDTVVRPDHTYESIKRVHLLQQPRKEKG